MNQEDVEILLVEDTPDDAELTIRTLKKRNLANRLHWVKDGAEAIDFLFGTGPHAQRARPGSLKLVLLDLKLPKIDGIEVLRRIKSDPALKATPVVVMTSSREEQDLVRSYDLNVNGYMVKPVDFDQFSEAVTHLGMFWLLVNKAPGS